MVAEIERTRRRTMPPGLVPGPGSTPASTPASADLPPRAEFLRLHHLVEAQRETGRTLALLFVAAGAGEGTSSLARGYAAAAQSEPGRPVLLLRVGDEADLDRRDTRPGLVEALRAGGIAAALIEHNSGPTTARLGAPANADELRSLFEALRQRFPTIVIDSPAVLAQPDALPLCRLVDGIVLVVQAEAARIEAVREARLQLERAGGTVIGSVLNRQRTTLPRWIEHWL